MNVEIKAPIRNFAHSIVNGIGIGVGLGIISFLAHKFLQMGICG